MFIEYNPEWEDEVSHANKGKVGAPYRYSGTLIMLAAALRVGLGVQYGQLEGAIGKMIGESRTPSFSQLHCSVGFYGLVRRRAAMPNCPECTATERKKVQAKYESETPEEDRSKDDLYRLYDEIEFPMKSESATKHFICRRCGLYATREQVSDIRIRLNRREKTRQDIQDDYLDWWQKSKKEKELE